MPEQVLVRDDDQRVDMLLQFQDAGFGDPHAALALELERLGDHADGEDAGVTGGAGHNGSSAGAGAAAHAGGDEGHVRAGEVIVDLVDRLFSRGAADLRLRAGAQPCVTATPIWIRRSALVMVSAWASVLATTNSTP
jgi:hypothetical protein